ncbi:MAG: NifU family protein [Bacteroidota bacterium]|nr:NifU family protein [Bacteroidota bacterium]
MSEQFITVYAEQTPNPESIKFVYNVPLIKGSRSYDFPYGSDTSISPLATALFKFNFIQGVFISQNFVSITKVEAAMWAELIPIIRTFLKEYKNANDPIVLDDDTGADDNVFEDSDTDIIKKIKEILSKNIKPVVEMDGGNIDFLKFDVETGQLTVALKGSCSGCPSSTVTLKSGIQNLMQRLVPEVKEVVAESL